MDNKVSLVPQLSKLCLTKLIDYIREKRHPWLHLIPQSEQRQRLLDLALAVGGVQTETACISLGSIEYLDEFREINTQRGIVSDRKYLNKVIESLNQVLSDQGQIIGHAITSLKLNIYLGGEGLMYKEKKSGKPALNFGAVIRLIGRCPNVENLDLKIKARNKAFQWEENIEDDLEPKVKFGEGSNSGGLLNQIEAYDKSCLAVLANLKSLSVHAERESIDILFDGFSIVQFNRISSLRLVSVQVDNDAWKNFLASIAETLTDLELKDVRMGLCPAGRIHTSVLPFPLSNLRTIKIGRNTHQDDKLFANLSRCPSLEKVSIDLAACMVQMSEWMPMLNRVEADVEISMCYYLWHGIERLNFDIGSGFFRWVHMFKDKIKEARFDFCFNHWNDQYSAALDHFFANCTNLHTLEFCGKGVCFSKFIRPLQSNNTESSTVVDPVRASKLRELFLLDSIDLSTLDSVFSEYLPNLKVLICWCPQLIDDHLIKLAAQGVKLREIDFRQAKITDEGMVPILVQGGEGLEKVMIEDSTGHPLTGATWQALVEHCPYFDKYRHCNPKGLRHESLLCMCHGIWDQYKTKNK